MLKRIYVDRHSVEANEHGSSREIYVVHHEDGTKQFGNMVVVMGPSVFKYNPGGCPVCGRRAWAETTADVLIPGGALTENQIQDMYLEELGKPCGDCP